MHPDPGHTRPLRVVVVATDDRVRESLAGLRCIGDRLDVVGTAGQAGPALDVIIATHPDIVVIDPRLPEMDGGLSFIARLRALAPDVRVLVMSGTDPAEGADMLRVGDGFVRKTFRPTDLVAAVCAAA